MQETAFQMDETLETLRRGWPMWGDQPKPYLRFEEVAALLGAVSWRSVQGELHRLEREGKVRCIYSSGLNQVWPTFLRDES